MVDDNIWDKVLEKAKKITGIEKIDSTNNLIDADKKFSNGINLKKVLILITSVMKDSNKSDLQIILQEPLVSKNWW